MFYFGPLHLSTLPFVRIDRNFSFAEIPCVTFELTNILMRRKYVEASYAFHIIYGLCITFILALFEGQTFLTSRRFTAVSFGKCRIFATL